MGMTCDPSGACPGLVWLVIIGAIITSALVPLLYVIIDTLIQRTEGQRPTKIDEPRDHEFRDVA